MTNTIKVLGHWFAGDNIEVVEIDGKAIALDGWNGEKFTECWECINTGGTTFTDIADTRTIEVKPVYAEIEEDEFEIVGYEIV